MKSVILQDLQMLYLQTDGKRWLVKHTNGGTVAIFSKKKDAEAWMDKVSERIKEMKIDGKGWNDAHVSWDQRGRQ